MFLVCSQSPEHGRFIGIHLCLSVFICGESFLSLCIEPPAPFTSARQVLRARARSGRLDPVPSGIQAESVA
jgi:hypothetical protein